MKKKIFVSVIIIHFCFCLFLSFDWSFLEGDYFGFGATFLLLYGLSVPLVASILAITDTLCQMIQKKQKKLDFVIGGSGILVLAAYLASASGVLRHTGFVGIIYTVLPIGTLAIIGCEAWKIIYQKNVANYHHKREHR